MICTASWAFSLGPAPQVFLSSRGRVVENQRVAGPNSTSFSSLSDVTPSNCWPVFSETWDGPHFTVPLLQDTIACIIPQECTFLLVLGSCSSSSSSGALHTQVVSLLIWNKVYTKENDVHFGMKQHQRNEMTPLYERPLGGNNHWDIWPWEDWCTAETHIVFYWIHPASPPWFSIFH